MKKFFALFTIISLVLSLAACGNKQDNNSSSATTTVNETTSTQAQTSAQAQASAQDALEILNTIWNSYGEDEKFSAIGGDASEENTRSNEPGVYSIADASVIDSALGFPAASIDKIDGAASLMHMLNANTFTCGAYHVKNAEDVSALADEIKTNITQRQWMCGFPDKLIVASMDDYIIAFFGEAEIMDVFKAKLNSAYPSAQIISEGAVLS